MVHKALSTRVVDASAIYDQIGSSINALVLMIAEKTTDYLRHWY
jgi:hypothetical protein